ncbi:MAG: YtxH domain-containing protein [Firmicutes bacterium]|nr:YtxH domain-containing protein [Bacillota bacterium]
MCLKGLLKSRSAKKRRHEKVQNAQKLAAGVGVATAGVIAGMLLAPKAGKEIRQDLKNKCCRKGGEISDKLGQKADIVKNKTAHKKK